MGSPGRLGRFAEPAMWCLVALRRGPRRPARLLDDIRAMDGPIGPGTLFAAISRLERLALVEPVRDAAGDRRYGLTSLGAEAAGAVGAIATARIDPSTERPGP